MRSSREWVIYNTGAMLKQLGFNLVDLARELAPVDTSGLNDPRYGEPTRLPGQGKPPKLPEKSDRRTSMSRTSCDG